MHLSLIQLVVQNIFKQDDIKPLNASDSGVGLISGLGEQGYILAIESINQKILSNRWMYM